MHPNEVRLIAPNGEPTPDWYVATEEVWRDSRKGEALWAQWRRQRDEMVRAGLRS